MANFESSPVQPVPAAGPEPALTPTINQLWARPSTRSATTRTNPACTSRATNYKKFGFALLHVDRSDVIKYQDKIDESPYVSDKSSYDSALEGIKSGKTNKFIQIITMQNHTPLPRVV